MAAGGMVGLVGSMSRLLLNLFERDKTRKAEITTRRPGLAQQARPTRPLYLSCLSCLSIVTCVARTAPPWSRSPTTATAVPFSRCWQSSFRYSVAPLAITRMPLTTKAMAGQSPVNDEIRPSSSTRLGAGGGAGAGAGTGGGVGAGGG